MHELIIEKRSAAALQCRPPPLTSRKSIKKRSPKPDVGITEIGNYVFGKTLGEGNFAKVKLAKHRTTGIEAAIKIIDKEAFDPSKLSKLNREVGVMKLLHHPGIVRLYEVIETSTKIFLVMEYVKGGELYDYIVANGRLTEDEARKKFRQLISAVSYCHNKRVIHRDLKAENLLLDTDLNIKIADFGFSSLYSPEVQLNTFCGSPPYAAPELFNGHKYTGPELDVWSLGVILYVMTTGCLPFNGRTLQEMKDLVCRGRYRIPFYLSEDCEKLIRKFLTRDPGRRLSLESIAEDPWINKNYTDSPLSVDGYEKVVQDCNLINIIHKKFKIPKKTIVDGLKNNVYDENMAIYYLLYHQKHRARLSDYHKSGNLPESPTADESSSDNDVLHSEGSEEVGNEGNETLEKNEDDTHQKIALGSSVTYKTQHRISFSAPTPSIPPPPAPESNIPISPDSPGTTFPLNNQPSSNSDTTNSSATNKRSASYVKRKVKGKLNVFVGSKLLNNVRNIFGDGNAPISSDCTKPRMSPPLILSDSLQESSLSPNKNTLITKRSSTISVKRAHGGVNFQALLSAFRNVQTSKNNRESSKAPTQCKHVDMCDSNFHKPAILGEIHTHVAKVGPESPPDDKSRTSVITEIKIKDVSIGEWEKLDPPPPLMIPGSSIENEKGRLKSIHTAFNLHATSKHHPDDIITCILHTSKKLNITCGIQDKYMLICNYNSGIETTNFSFKVEVCKLARLKSAMYGLKLKRTSGDARMYRGIMELFLLGLRAEFDKFVPTPPSIGK